MDLLSQLSREARAELFPPNCEHELKISPVLCISDAIHFIGISLGTDLRYIMAYLSASDQANDDLEHMQVMAHNWTHLLPGARVEPAARIIKFFRAEAADATEENAKIAFDPAHWPLPKPHTIWHLHTAITEAINAYIESMPDVNQFFYMPQTDALERWYSRLQRQLCRANSSGVVFRVIATPAPDTGGFHGFERVQASQAV